MRETRKVECLVNWRLAAGKAGVKICVWSTRAPMINACACLTYAHRVMCFVITLPMLQLDYALGSDNSKSLCIHAILCIHTYDHMQPKIIPYEPIR